MAAMSDNVVARYKTMRYKGLLERGRNARGRVCRASGDNPLCGDSLEVELEVCDGAIRAARFDGYGCSLCLASADVLMERVEGMPVGDALRLSCDDMKRMWGGIEVGRTRESCLGLALAVMQDALRGVANG